MNIPWSPIVFVDIFGSVLTLLISYWCTKFAWQLTKKKPEDVFRNYLFLFTLAILFFAVSRSFGHLVKQLLLTNDMALTWQQIAPFSGAINSTAFVVLFTLSLSFNRFQKVHSQMERYKDNLEEMVAIRTEELEKAMNTLENILDNSNPINITGVNFDLLRANEAYYSIWPRVENTSEVVKCYQSRPGDHCHTDECPLKMIVEGSEEVVQEVSKTLDGEIRDFIITARPFRDVEGKLIGMVESFQDITLRKRAEKAVRESEERFRQIFESNPDPVILATLADGKIIDVNKAFENATGISRTKAISHNSDELGFWVDKGFRKTFRKELKSHGEIYNYEADFRVVGGKTKTGLVSACIMNVANAPCILLVIRDITVEKAAERALLEMDRMKSEFISTAAHELNTPLSTMMGYTEFIKSPKEFGGFTDQQKADFINEIYANGETLRRIIDDLLDISRIESGRPIPMVLEEIDLGETLRNKVNSYVIQNTGYSFQLELPSKPVQPLFILDRHRINQVFENLLSNAVKYSSEGSEITITGKEKNDGWEIRIKDQGVGMNADQVNHVFDKFYRVDASNTARQGLGLGMSIVKQTITAHGGDIRVESTKGQGTVVIFNLPYNAG
jgi:PAS domain S-box-containing protein